MALQTAQQGRPTMLQPVSADLKAAFIACHSEGHQWRHQGKVGGSEPGASPPFGLTDAVARYSVCLSCTSERFRWYTRSGEAVNRYRYAEGYTHRKLSEDDDPAPTKQWWRQQLVISLFDDMAPRAPRRRKAS